MDYLSDMCSRVNVALERKKIEVTVPKSKEILNILICLYNEGYIAGFFVKNSNIVISLKYRGDKPVFNKLVRLSKRSKRRFVTKKEVERLEGFFLIQNPSNIFMNNSNKGITGGELTLQII